MTKEEALRFLDAIPIECGDVDAFERSIDALAKTPEHYFLSCEELRTGMRCEDERKGRRETMGKESEYIVKKSQVLNGVRYALETAIENTDIVNILMKGVDYEISTILEDDCEEVSDEMLSAWML